VDDLGGQRGANMNEIDGAQLQLEVGECVILIGAIIDAALPGLVRKAGVGQRTQGEQGAHEKLCQPKAKAHLETFRTSISQRSQLMSNRGRRRQRQSAAGHPGLLPAQGKNLSNTEMVKRGLAVIETAATGGAETVRRIRKFARLRPDEPFITVDLFIPSAVAGGCSLTSGNDRCG
jgi:hypothetical protein